MDEEHNALTIGWLAIVYVLASFVSFALGFCVKTRLYERQLDELVHVVKRPSTFGGSTSPPPTSSGNGNSMSTSTTSSAPSALTSGSLYAQLDRSAV